MNNKIVYLHRKDTDGKVFYVGMGNKKRAYSKQRSKRWHNVVKKHGFYVDIISENLNNEDAFELECFLIQIYGRLDINTGSLVNMTEGGVGTSGLNCSIKERRKYVMSKVERSLEWRQNISKSSIGKIFSEETLKKMSNAKIGKKVTEETKINMRKSNRSKEISGVKLDMFCFDTDNFLQSFESILDAANFIKRNRSSVFRVISKEIKYTTIKETNKKVIFKKK